MRPPAGRETHTNTDMSYVHACRAERGILIPRHPGLLLSLACHPYASFKNQAPLSCHPGFGGEREGANCQHAGSCCKSLFCVFYAAVLPRENSTCSSIAVEILELDHGHHGHPGPDGRGPSVSVIWSRPDDVVRIVEGSLFYLSPSLHCEIC